MPSNTLQTDYELAATLVAQGCTLKEVAVRCGTGNAQSLRKGLARRGVTAIRLRSTGFSTPSPESAAMRLARDASSALKEVLGNTLAKHCTALERVPARTNLKHIQSVGSAMEPLARIAKIVHDWGNETKSGLIILGVVEQLSAKQDALEVQASVQPSEDKPVP